MATAVRKRGSRAAYHREYRRRKQLEAARRDAATLHEAIESAGRLSAEIAIEWIERCLLVPTGPLAGKPFKVPQWERQWLLDACEPGVREAGLSIARKNGKSGLIAAWLLAHIVGPLNVPEWRCVVASLTGLLAKELRTAIEQTAAISGFSGELRVRLSPMPGVIVGKNGARVDFLAADKASGHALGADLALIDEAGLLQENKRGLWNALFSSISGRDGKFWAISIQGDGPMFAEMEEREGSPKLHWRKWATPMDCDLLDRDGWLAGNPGIADGIKAEAYMQDAAERAMASPGNEMHFRAYDLNQPVDPERQVIVTVADYAKCLDRDAPGLLGDVVVGIDLGGSSSMTAAAAISLQTGRILTRGAFGDDPPISARAKNDRMGSLYDRMIREGELKLYPGRVTPVVAFLEEFFTEIGKMGRVLCVGADRHRRAEAEMAFADAGLPFLKVYWRGQGAAATADGSRDVRAFQRYVLGREMATPGSTMLESAIASSVLRFDGAGNPALDKARNNARIDALSAAVIAAGLREMELATPDRQMTLTVV